MASRQVIDYLRGPEFANILQTSVYLTVEPLRQDVLQLQEDVERLDVIVSIHASVDRRKKPNQPGRPDNPDVVKECQDKPDEVKACQAKPDEVEECQAKPDEVKECQAKPRKKRKRSAEVLVEVGTEPTSDADDHDEAGPSQDRDVRVPSFTENRRNPTISDILRDFNVPDDDSRLQPLLYKKFKMIDGKLKEFTPEKDD